MKHTTFPVNDDNAIFQTIYQRLKLITHGQLHSYSCPYSCLCLCLCLWASCPLRHLAHIQIDCEGVTFLIVLLYQLERVCQESWKSCGVWDCQSCLSSYRREVIHQIWGGPSRGKGRKAASEGWRTEGSRKEGKETRSLAPFAFIGVSMMLIYDSAGLLSTSRFAISAAAFCSSYICMAFSSP